MIRPLRERHRRVVSLLALILPVGYLVLLTHRAPAEPDALPFAADLSGRVPSGPAFELLAEPRLEGRLLGTRGEGTPDALQITPSGDPGIPDLLAYWSPVAGDGHELPPGATFIGALSGSREQVFPMPAPGIIQGGHVILFSPARGEIIAGVPLPGQR